MKNKNNWKPSKFVETSKGWITNPDPKMVSRSSRIVVDAMVKHYEKAVKTHSSGLLLDLGCGHVPFYGMYKDLVTDCICVDWENSMHKNQFLDHSADLNQALPLESEVFDTIICTDVLEHIYKPHQLIAEMARVSKKDGKLIIGVPFYYWLHETPFDYYRYTEFALRQMIEDQGFKVISIDAYGGSPEIFGDFISKHLSTVKPLLYIHNLIWRSILSLSFIKKISAQTSKKFPLGYCLVAQKMAE